MSEKIVTLNEEVIKGEIRELVRGSVEETLNNLLEAEADRLTQAARYERSEDRQGYRSGHYDRGLTTTSGEATLHVPRLKGCQRKRSSLPIAIRKATFCIPILNCRLRRSWLICR